MMKELGRMIGLLFTSNLKTGNVTKNFHFQKLKDTNITLKYKDGCATTL